MSDRKCKRRRPERDGLRPSDVLAAFFLAGIGFIVFAVAVGVLGHFVEIGNVRWLVLHAVFLGGISQFIFGAAQFFAGAFLATGPPSRALVRTQFAFWNIGTVLLLATGPFSNRWLTTISALLLLAALLALTQAFNQLRRESLQEMPWATRWYQAATGFLVIGIVLGAVLAAGEGGARSGDLLAAHLSLNLIGWLGTAIVGTLHTFYPSLSGAGLWRPGLQAKTFYLWVLGTASLAVGFGLSLHLLIVVGVALIIAAGALLTLNIVGSYRAATEVTPLSAKLVGAAQLCLLPGLVVAAVGLISNDYSLIGAYRSATAVLLLQGWIGLTVVGSLMHLLNVLARVRNLAAPERVVSTPLCRALAPCVLMATAAAAIAYLAGLDGLARGASFIAVAAFLILGVSVVRLAYNAARVAPLRL